MTCTICLQLIDTETNDCYFLVCAHKFHTGCIKEWLINNDYCPICKTPSFIADTNELQYYLNFIKIYATLSTKDLVIKYKKHKLSSNINQRLNRRRPPMIDTIFFGRLSPNNLEIINLSDNDVI